MAETALVPILLFAISAAAEPENQANHPAGSLANHPCQAWAAASVEPEYIDECRPQPVSDAWRESVLRSLPPDGEVTRLDAAQRRKLEAQTEVLRSLAREGVYEIKVIDVPQAFAGLHGKVVLLISLPLLQLLNAEELQAITAHEVGHEYIWEEYEVAQRQQDKQRLQELEMVCDAIAALALLRLGLPPERLIDALDKLSQFNRRRFGVALNESDYASLGDRREAVKRLVARW